MKKLLALPIVFALFFSTVAFAAPLYIFQKTIIPEIDSTYTLGTTTKAWLNIYTDEVCLAGDCKTAWPTGGGGGGSGVGWATNTPSNVLYSTEGNHVVISASDKSATTTNAVLQVWGGLSGDYFYATNTATSSFFTNLRANNGTTSNLYTTTFGVGTDYITDITGTGLSVVGGVLTASGGGGSISTSSVPVAGNLAYWTSGSALSDVATGTLTEGITGLEFTATRGLVGGAAILNLTTGYSMFLTASGTNWNTFYDTPSNRITAGTGIDWSGNTLNGVYTAGDALTLTGEDFDFDGGAAPGGELGNTWASPTIDDSLAVTSWNLTTPTLTSFFGTPCTGNQFLQDIGDTGAFSCATASGADGVSNWTYNGSRLTPSTTVGIGVFASSTIGGGTALTGLTVSGSATTTGTSTVQTMIVKGSTSATSTAYIYSTTAGLGGQFILEDSDAAGCTQVTALNGVLSAATVSCPQEY